MAPSRREWCKAEDIVLLFSLRHGNSHEHCSELLATKQPPGRSIPALRRRLAYLKRTHPMLWDSERRVWVHEYIDQWIEQQRYLVDNIDSLIDL